MKFGLGVPGWIKHCVLCEPNRPRAKQKSEYGASGGAAGRGNKPTIFGFFGSVTSTMYGRVIVFAAVRFQRLMVRKPSACKLRMCGIGNQGKTGVKRNRAKGVEFILRVTQGLGMLDVAQIHAVHAEGAEAPIANSAAVLNALGNA